MHLAVVIPTYNEAANVVALYERLRSVLPNTVPLIFVDDASPDGTASLLRERGDDCVHIISRRAKLGLGSAYREGFAKAIGLGCEWVAQMDADLSHGPDDLLHLRDKALGNNRLIIGSRYVDGGAIVGWGPWRHFCSRSAMGFSRLCLDLKTRDVTSGFRLWAAPLLARVLQAPMASDGYAFQEEMLFRAQKIGAEIIEVPITFRDRQLGQSKLRWRDVWEFFVVMRALRRQK